MNKNKLSIILAIASVLLPISAMFALFAPIISLGCKPQGYVYSDVLFWGTLGSFFTLAFGLNSTFLCDSAYSAYLYRKIYYPSFGPNAGLIALFIIEILLFIVGVITIILILIKKYKRKAKLFLPFITSALLINAIVLSFSMPLFFDKRLLYDVICEICIEIEVDWDYPTFHLELGSIVYIIICSFALFASVTNVIINRKENFAIKEK